MYRVRDTRPLHRRLDVADGRHRVDGVRAASHARPPLAQRRYQRPTNEDPREGACAGLDPARAGRPRASTECATEEPGVAEGWR